MKKNKLLLFVTLFFCISMMATIHAGYAVAGTPHLALGSITNSDASIPAANDIQFTAYISTRTDDVLTQSSPGCSYDGTTYGVEVGNFTQPWTAGEILVIEFVNMTALEAKTIEVTLTTAGIDTTNVQLESIAPATLTIAPVDPTVQVPNTQQFTGTATFAGVSGDQDVTNKVTWNSSDADKGTINAAGLFTPVHIGGTDITASLSGVTSNTSTVTVTAGTLVTLTVIPDTKTLTADQTQQFTVTGVDAKGNAADMGTITWSGGAEIGTIDATTGLFDATTVATGTVTATSSVGSVTDTTGTITVTAGALATLTVSPDTASLTADDTQQFTVTGVDADDNSVSVGTITWSGGAGIGAINATGLFDATTVGTGTVTATSDLGSITDSSGTITVSHGAAEKIKLTSSKSQLVTNGTDTTEITGTIVDHYGNTVTDYVAADVVFSLDAITYGTFGGAQNVTVTAANIANGKALATLTSVDVATGGDIKVSAISGALNSYDPDTPVNVYIVVAAINKILDSIEIGTVAGGLVNTTSPKVGETVQFKATGHYKLPGQEVDLSLDEDVTTTVTWNSSDATKGTIGANTGLFDAVAEGSANVTATFAGVTSNTVAMDVKAAEAVTIDTTKLSETMTAGETVDFGAVTSGGTGVGFTYTIDSQPTGDPGILTADGKFSVDETKAFAGVYVIKATDINSGAFASYTLKVPIKLTPDSKAFTETKLDGSDNSQSFTVTGAGSDYTWEILDSETATTEVDTPAGYGTWSASGTATEILTPANVDAVKKFYVRVTVENDADLTEGNGLNKRVFGPFNLIPVDTFTVTVSHSDETAIVGASVNVDYSDPDLLTPQVTNVDGEAVFTLPDADGTYSYTVTADGKVSQEISSTSKDVAVTLEDIGYTITGTVEDTLGTAKDGATVTAYQPSDITTKYQATTAGGGAYTINMPVGAALEEWTVVASLDGFVSVSQADQAVDTAVDFTGAYVTGYGLQEKTTIGTVETTDLDTTTVQMDIKASSTSSAAFMIASEVSVALIEGSGALGALSHAGDTVSVAYSCDPMDDFTVVIKADTSEDHNPATPYFASRAFSYVAEDTATATAQVDVEAGSSGGETVTDPLLTQSATVEVPVGGLTEDATIVIKQVPKDDTTATSTQASPTYVYEVTATHNAGDNAGSELTGEEVTRVEITLPIDLSVVSPGDLEEDVFVIYRADSLAALEAGGGTAVPADPNIISTDYIGDGSIGSVTFYVSSLSFLGIGGGGGGDGPLDDDNCFIATAAYGSLFESHVEILRDFRDVYLMPSKIGHAFVDAYYRYSPKAAAFIADHDSLRAVTRVALLPVVGMSYAALHTTVSQKALIIFLMFSLFAGAYMTVRRFKIRRTA